METARDILTSVDHLTLYQKTRELLKLDLLLKCPLIKRTGSKLKDDTVERQRHWTIADIACEFKIAFIWITGLDGDPNSAERHLRLCMCALKTRVWMCVSFCVTRSPWTRAAPISQEISIQLRCRLSSKHHRLQNTVASLSHLIEGALISLYTATKCMHVTLQPKAHTQRATVKTWLLITAIPKDRLVCWLSGECTWLVPMTLKRLVIITTVHDFNSEADFENADAAESTAGLDKSTSSSQFSVAK